MKKVIRLTESDLTRIVKRAINESKAQEMANNALLKSNQADSDMKSEIIKCIKSGSYSHLMVLTTGAGATALGALAVLFASGLGTVPALILTAAGAAIVTIEGLMTTDGSGRGSVTDEVSQLYSCLKQKVNMNISKYDECLKSGKFVTKKNNKGEIYKQYDAGLISGLIFREEPRLDIHGFMFFKDGRVYNPETKKTSKYFCKDGEVEVVGNIG